MWSDLIVSLDLPPSGEILLLGDDVAHIELPVGAGQRFDNGNLVLVTRGGAPVPEATALDTGLEPDRLDLVILRDAAGSVENLRRVLLEAFRILKPGGGVMLTEFDASTLLDSRPQRYPQLLLSNLYPRVGEYLRSRHPRQMDIGRTLVKTGFRDGDAYSLDFPLGHFSDYGTYVDSVAVEGWRGMDQLTAEELDDLLEQLPGLMKSVAPAGEFDDVEPVTVARAYKPES
jgi:SAM-dependent methyltransferase